MSNVNTRIVSGTSRQPISNIQRNGFNVEVGEAGVALARERLRSGGEQLGGGEREVDIRDVLPEEMFVHICEHLGVVDRIRFGMTCKLFKEIIEGNVIKFSVEQFDEAEEKIYRRLNSLIRGMIEYGEGVLDSNGYVNFADLSEGVELSFKQKVYQNPDTWRGFKEGFMREDLDEIERFSVGINALTHLIMHVNLREGLTLMRRVESTVDGAERHICGVEEVYTVNDYGLTRGFRDLMKFIVRYLSDEVLCQEVSLRSWVQEIFKFACEGAGNVDFGFAGEIGEGYFEALLKLSRRMAPYMEVSEDFLRQLIAAINVNLREEERYDVNFEINKIRNDGVRNVGVKNGVIEGSVEEEGDFDSMEAYSGEEGEEVEWED